MNLQARRVLVCSLLCLGFTACSFRLKLPDMKGIYQRNAQYHGVERNPIVVIPGILGSRLVEPTAVVSSGAPLGETTRIPIHPKGCTSLLSPWKRESRCRICEMTLRWMERWIASSFMSYSYHSN
jgi:hypothetical protein